MDGPTLVSFRTLHDLQKYTDYFTYAAYSVGPKYREMKVFESWPHVGETKQALPVNTEYYQRGVDINDWGLWETKDGLFFKKSFTDTTYSKFDLRRQEADRLYEEFVGSVRFNLGVYLRRSWRHSVEPSIEFAASGSASWKQRGEIAEQQDLTHCQIANEARLDIKAGKSIIEAEAIVASLTYISYKVLHSSIFLPQILRLMLSQKGDTFLICNADAFETVMSAALF